MIESCCVTALKCDIHLKVKDQNSISILISEYNILIEGDVCLHVVVLWGTFGITSCGTSVSLSVRELWFDKSSQPQFTFAPLYFVPNDNSTSKYIHLNSTFTLPTAWFCQSGATPKNLPPSVLNQLCRTPTTVTRASSVVMQRTPSRTLCKQR